jgi:hypothetical protein
MQVPGRAALRPKTVLDDEQAVAVLRHHFEGNGADAESPLLAKSIFTGGYPQDGGNTGLIVQSLVHYLSLSLVIALQKKFLTRAVDTDWTDRTDKKY